MADAAEAINRAATTTAAAMGATTTAAAAVEEEEARVNRPGHASSHGASPLRALPRRGGSVPGEVPRDGHQPCGCRSNRPAMEQLSAFLRAAPGEGETEGEMATKRSVGTLGDKDLRGKKVFLRADLNILLDDSQNITDENCIRASVLSIKFLMAKGAKAILANHLVSTLREDLECNLAA
ncbi:phosphoglycerate kinase, chloroplastic-like [Triticum urartu]|uniref:phosphoglycerate kinase, chloroplastic-like n=1 Tax=Triticum urartu TaxID=4572 RepID=UPI002043E953|nr:phosphoglycerate kinase, chloroplastic-like [Triticum urartu]